MKEEKFSSKKVYFDEISCDDCQKKRKKRGRVFEKVVSLWLKRKKSVMSREDTNRLNFSIALIAELAKKFDIQKLNVKR